MATTGAEEEAPGVDGEPHRRQGAGTAAMVAAVLAWGITSVIPRSITSVGGVALSFHRLWLAAVVTTAAFLLTGGRLSWRLLRLCLPGGIAFAADVAFFFSAVKHTTIANATVIGSLQPVLVLLVVGRLFGERVYRRDLAWAAVALAGVAIVVFGSTGAPTWSPLGDAFAVAALFAWAAYFVVSKQARQHLTTFEYQTGLTIIAACAIAPLALLGGQTLAVGSAHDWLLIALLGLTSGLLGHVLANWAHAHVDLSRASLLTLGIPVVATASAAVFLDEPVNLVQVAGMVMVVVALGVVVWHEGRRALRATRAALRPSRDPLPVPR